METSRKRTKRDERMGPPGVVHEPSEVGCAPSEQEREDRCRRRDTYREDFKEAIGGMPEFRRRKDTLCRERLGRRKGRSRSLTPFANDATGFGMTGCGAGARRKTAG